MTDRELMQQVLDMIAEGDNVRWTYAHDRVVADAIRARLVQPEPTLVLWNVKDNRLASASDDHAHVFAIRQREWQGLTQGLTDEEYNDIYESIYDPKGFTSTALIRAIEAKLKEKNT